MQKIKNYKKLNVAIARRVSTEKVKIKRPHSEFPFSFDSQSVHRDDKLSNRAVLQEYKRICIN